MAHGLYHLKQFHTGGSLRSKVGSNIQKWAVDRWIFFMRSTIQGVLPSHEKEGDSDTYNIDEDWKSHAKWEKPQKVTYYMKPLYERSQIGKFIETDSRSVVTRHWGGGKWGLTAQECRVSFWGDENVLVWWLHQGVNLLNVTHGWFYLMWILPHFLKEPNGLKKKKRKPH